MERIIHSRISDFLHAYKLLSNCQFGFRPRSSTLLSVTNTWHNLLSDNKQIAAVFFDVKKAFDTVPHNHLLRALSQSGITGPLLDWISDYLSNRSQKVVLDGTCSNSAQVTSGVPQGSILGPLLFNIFMNSISSLPLSSNSSLILYADDILLSKPINTDKDIRDLQHDVNLISTWMASNGLTPNLKKTQLLPARSPPTIRINLNGHPVAQCKSAKYLGVTISSDLSWKEHVTMTCKKAKQQLGLIHVPTTPPVPSISETPNLQSCDTPQA